IGVDRTVAFAGRRACRELPVRWPALRALVATSAFLTAALITAAAKFAFIPVLMPVLALKAFARRAALVLARFANRRRVRCCNGFDRRIGAGLAEIIVAVAPSASMPLAPGAISRIVCNGRRRRALLRVSWGTILMTMAMALMTWPAIIR